MTGFLKFSKSIFFFWDGIKGKREGSIYVHLLEMLFSGYAVNMLQIRKIKLLESDHTDKLLSLSCMQS